MQNQDVIDLAKLIANVSSDSKLAAHLSQKYGVVVTRQQIWQFKKSHGSTLATLLLSEFAEQLASIVTVDR